MLAAWQQIWQKLGKLFSPRMVIERTNGLLGARRREFVVIGLGRFGTSVATTLVGFGHEVLAIDADPQRVHHLSTELPNVAQLDATNATALRQIGIADFDTGLVCIGSDFESNLLATVLLLRFGVKRVITKARTRTQRTILESVGAHEVILPEQEAGTHLGQRLAFRHFVEYLEIGRGIGIVEFLAPSDLWGQTLVQSNLRQRFGLTVVAVHRGDNVIVNPEPEIQIQQGDILAVVGRIEDAARLQP